MTNLEYIRTAEPEKLAELLNVAAYGLPPWEKPFDEACCSKCPSEEVAVDGYENPMKLKECDFADGKCPHGSAAEWWLKQKRKEDDEDA